MKFAIIRHVIKHILDFMRLCNTPKGVTVQTRVAGMMDTYGLIPQI